MRRVIIFDGECRLCNGAVDFVVRRDPKRYFQFASLQSEVARQLLKEVAAPLPPPASSPANPGADETIYLIEGDTYYTRSTAALRIAKKLRFPWPLLYVGSIVPRFIRNAIYNYIGRNRKKWFGVTNTCDTRREEEERDRFLD